MSEVKNSQLIAIRPEDKIRFGPKSIEYITGEDYKFNILHGSIRSGKTWTAAVKWLQRIMNLNESHKHLIGGVTATTSKINNIYTLMEIMDTWGMEYEYKKAEWTLNIINRNGVVQECFIRGFNNAETLSRIKGMTLYSALLDELSELNYEGLRMLETRLTLPGSFFIATTNPPPKNSWLDTYYLSNDKLLGDPSFYFQHYQLSDNITLTSEYIDFLNTLHPPGTFFHDMYIRGIITKAEGIIYTGFNDFNLVDKHVAQASRLYIGSDVGPANVTCFTLFGYYLPTEEYPYPHMVLLDELVFEKKDMEVFDETDLIAILQEEWPYRIARFYVPHDGVNMGKVARKAKFSVKVHKPDRLAEIQEINSYFNKNKFLINRGCEKTIACLYNYVWDKKKADMGKSEPNKVNGFDHLPDSFAGPVINHLKGSIKYSSMIDEPTSIHKR